MPEITCMHWSCRGTAYGRELKNEFGDVYAVEYTCACYGSTWTEYK